MKTRVLEIEGTDGAGKSTALKYLIEKLRAAGKRVLETREVGSPHIPTCVKLRELVLDPASDLAGDSMEFIFAAMRIENQKFYEKVGNDYDFIVSDRGWLSHLAYTDHNVSKDFTDNFYYKIVKPITTLPDIVVYLDVNTDTALKRRVKRGTGMDVIEMKGVEFQEKVRKSFEEHIKFMKMSGGKTQVFTVNANQDVNGVQQSIDDLVKELL